MSEPASIRYKNPGAMWGGTALARKWGATANIALHDGLHQNNHIADFPDFVHGAAAQFDLWRESYVHMTLRAAIRKWSGGNDSSEYMAFLNRHTGISDNDTITPELLAGPKGRSLMKAQAQWEAGKPYPLTDDQWAEAQRMVFA